MTSLSFVATDSPNPEGDLVSRLNPRNHSARYSGGCWQSCFSALCTDLASKPASRQTSRKSAEGTVPIQRSASLRLFSFRGFEVHKSLTTKMTTERQRFLEVIRSIKSNAPVVTSSNSNHACYSNALWRSYPSSIRMADCHFKEQHIKWVSHPKRFAWPGRHVT